MKAIRLSLIVIILISGCAQDIEIKYITTSTDDLKSSYKDLSQEMIRSYNDYIAIDNAIALLEK